MQKGICVIVPLFDVTLCLPILHSLRLPHFLIRLLLQVKGRMMIYWFIMFSYRFLATPAPISVKPLITQVYSRCQKLVVSSPTPIASTLDPVFSNDFPITLRKGKRQNVHPQFPHFVLITICHHIPILLLHP